MRPRFVPQALASASLVLGMIAAPLFRADAAPADYAKKLTLTVNPARVGFDTGDVTDVPVAVRLSESITDFDYDDFLVANGGDLLFTDDAGNVLSHEIEFWDATGESIVWVKMPTFGPGQKIYAYYGGPANAQNAVGVWGAYVGVWHMAEADGTVADATGNGLDASPAGDNTSQSIATTGPIGNARVNATGGSTTYLNVPYSSTFDLGDTLSFSGWVKASAMNENNTMAIVMRKESTWDGGWCVKVPANSSTAVWFWGSNNNYNEYLGAPDVPDMLSQWVHVTVTYSGYTGHIYINGRQSSQIRIGDNTSNTWISHVQDNGKPLSFGYTSNGHYEVGPHLTDAFQGDFDEFRLSGGTKSAAQVAAEYAAQMPDALTYAVADNSAPGYATIAPANFLKRFTISMNSYTADDTFADFPMLVRLSPTAISGFSYADFVQSDYSDLAFFDASGNPLAFDVDTWNPLGESLVWVKVPSFSKTTTVTAAYGGLVRNDIHQTATWSAYRGVWHLNETGDGAQTIADATANDMDGTAHSATAYVPAGQLGGSRRMATNRGASDQNGGVRIQFNPAMNKETDGNFRLVVSSWVNLDIGGNWGGALFMRKNDMDDGGWGMAYHFTEMNHFDYYFRESYDGIYTPHSDGGGGYTQYNASESIWKTSGTANEWHKYTVVYYWTGSYIVCQQYLDGEKGSDCWLYNFTDDGNGNSTGERSYAPLCQPTDKGLALGAFIGSGRHPLLGAMDEARLRFGDTSSTREALEYGQESSAAYYTYSAVEDVPGSTVPGIVVFGSPLPDPTVVTNGGTITFTIDIPIQSVLGDSGAVQLLLDAAEPKDGADVVPTTVVGTQTASAPGTLTFTWSCARLGTEVRYRAISVTPLDATHNWTSETETKSVTLPDTADYTWVANAQGRWSNPANWTTSATDGLPRIGYPTAGCKINFYGNQTDVVEVDAAYTGIHAGTLGWGGADITFRGVVDGAGVAIAPYDGFKDGQYDDIAVTLDGVAFENVGNYHIKNNASLTMLNGAYLYTRWEFTLAGENASLFVGDGCELYQYGVDGNRFEFSGENASIVISNGLIRANILRINGKGDSDTDFAGKAPAGITFLGDHPQLNVLQYAKVHADGGADIPVTFSIPVNGFATTPIVKASATNRGFAEKKSGVEHGLKFRVDPASPFFAQNARKTLEQQLLDWSYNGTSYAISTDGIVLANSGKTTMAFTPEDSATKSGVVASLKVVDATVILFR